MSAAPSPPGSPGPEPALLVEDVAFTYPDGHQALYGVDLRIDRGERVALLGPNGAGKTTLVLHLNGVLSGGRGRVTVAGLPVEKRNPQEVRRRVGIVFQDPNDQLFMPTVGEDVAFGPRNQPAQPRPARARGRRAGGRGAGPGGHGPRGRPPAAPPVVRSAPPGRRRHRAVDAPGGAGARRAVVQPRPGRPAGAGRGPAGPTGDMLMVTHHLSYALQLCPRSVVLDGGVGVVDGPTRELLADGDLLAAHRLELPYGFDHAPV